MEGDWKALQSLMELNPNSTNSKAWTKQELEILLRQIHRWMSIQESQGVDASWDWDVVLEEGDVEVELVVVDVVVVRKQSRLCSVVFSELLGLDVVLEVAVDMVEQVVVVAGTVVRL